MRTRAIWAFVPVLLGVVPAAGIIPFKGGVNYPARSRVESTTSDGGGNSALLNSLAEHVKQVYRETKYLSFDADVVEKNRRVHLSLAMADGKVLARVFIADELVLSMLGNNGTFIESRSPWKGFPAKVVQYTCPVPGGSDNTKLLEGIEDYRCMLGSYGQSWVGKSTRKAVFFSDGIAQGQLREPELIQNQECKVVLWERKDASRHRQDVFYVNAAFFIVRWDSLESWDGSVPKRIRIREYKNLKTDAIPESFWKLDSPNERWANPATP